MCEKWPDFGEKHWLDVHREEWIDDLTSLLKIPSLSQKCCPESSQPFGKECAEALDRALAIAQKYGLEVQCHQYYCGTAVLRGTQPALGEIGIFLHLDVVPPGEGWQYPPFEAVRKDGYIIARGSRDNKGAAIAALYALRYLREKGISLKHNVRLFFGCNEELGMEDIQYYLKSHEEPVFSLVPDSPFPVCYGEKGVIDLKIKKSRRGSKNVLCSLKGGIAINQVPDLAEATLQADGEWMSLEEKEISVTKEKEKFHVKAHGRAAHSASPEGAANAVVKLAKYLKDTGVLEEDELNWMEFIVNYFDSAYGENLGIASANTEGDRLTCVVTMMNVSENEFQASINIRYPAHEAGELICRKLQEKMGEAGISIEEMSDNPGYCLDRNYQLINILNDIVCRRLGMEKQPYIAKGGTYARKLTHPAVGFGPNQPGRHPFGPGKGTGHLPDEAVSISELETAMMIYAQALPAIDNYLKNYEEEDR